MKKPGILFIISIIFFLSIYIRIPFRSNMFVNCDGPQFAIAMQRYSLKDYFPAPPGHFLYVMTAKLINTFLHDPFSSLLWLSIIFSGLTCAVLFLIGARIFNVKVGLISSLVYMASPLFWFHSTTITALPMSGFFALITGFFLFEVICKKKEGFFLWSSFSYGLMIGTRPQDFIFILPLWIWAMFNLNLKTKILGLLTLAVICFSWFIPLGMMSGGIKEFIAFILRDISSGSTRLSSSVFTLPHLLKANLKFQIFAYFISFGLTIIPFFYYLPQFFSIKNIFSDKKRQVFLIWIIPSLIFWSIYNFASPGYIIVSLLPMVILLAEFLVRMTDELRQSIPVKIRYIENSNIILAMFMFIFIIVNSIGYFYDFGSIPKESYADSFRRYPDNKKLDLIFSQAFKYIRENIPKENSVIVAPSYLFPPVMYYLPEYDVYVFGAIKDGSSNGLYAHNFKRYKLLDFQTIKFISDSHLKGKYVVFMNERLNNQFDIKSQKEAIYLLGEWKLIVAHP